MDLLTGIVIGYVVGNVTKFRENINKVLMQIFNITKDQAQKLYKLISEKLRDKFGDKPTNTD